MKWIYLFLVFLIVMSVVIAQIGFQDETLPFTVTLDGTNNNTQFLQVPMYAEVQQAQMQLVKTDGDYSNVQVFLNYNE